MLHKPNRAGCSSWINLKQHIETRVESTLETREQRGAESTQPEQMMNGEQCGDQKNAEEILRNINKISVANKPHWPPTRLQTTLIPSKKHSTGKQHENQTSRTKKQERNRHLTKWIRKNRLDGADEKTKWGKRKAPGPSEGIQSVW